MRGKIIRFLERIKKIHKDTNTNYLSILLDFWSLKQKLNISFYEYYCFYLDENQRLRETFLSKINKTKFLSIINPRNYYIIARNKYLSHLFFNSTTIQRSELYLYYNPIVSSTGVICTNEEEVSLKIKNLGIKEFVIKTTESSHGEGVIVIKNVREEGNKLILSRIDGKEIILTEILNREPLIFEKLIEQTEQFKSFNPTSVNTLRITTNLFPNGEVKIMHCNIKIGRKGAWIDNAGSGGNICAKVDIQSGILYNVIEFNGWRNIKKVTHHTDNKVLLEGIKIENWGLLCEQVKSFQKQMPFLKAIGWDVAITNKGAVIIEMNDFWDETFQILGEGWLPQIKELYNQWNNEYKTSL